MTELQSCVSKTNSREWAIWIRGVYLGSITTDAQSAFYTVISSRDKVCGKVSSFAAAMATFMDSAEMVVIRDEKAEIERWIDAVTRETIFRRWGLSEPKTIWQKIKGLFK